MVSDFSGARWNTTLTILLLHPPFQVLFLKERHGDFAKTINRKAPEIFGQHQVPKKGCTVGGRQYPLEACPESFSAGNTAETQPPETETGP